MSIKPICNQDDLWRNPASGAEEELLECLQRPGQDHQGGGSDDTMDRSHANHSQVANTSKYLKYFLQTRKYLGIDSSELL